MLQEWIGESYFFALVTALAFAAGRGLKAALPRLRPDALPWIVMGVGFGLFFADALALGMSPKSALDAALSGLMFGGLAVTAHEALKGFMSPELAAKLLGKLRGGK